MKNEESDKINDQLINLASLFLPISKNINVEDLTLKQLIFIHNILHVWEQKIKSGEKIRGWTKEDVFNLHELITKELSRRGWIKTPIFSKNSVEKISLSDFLSKLPKRIRINPDNVPFIWLTGGLVNRGWTGGKHDIDVLIRIDQKDERFSKALLNLLPTNIADKLHFIWTNDTPKVGNATPLYHLELVRVDQNEDEKLQFKLKPLTPFTPMKSAGGYHKLEFFTDEDLWKYWAKGVIDEGIAVEEKFDGMRMVIHKKGNQVKIFTEDKKRDRSHMFPKVVEEVKNLKPKELILDCEMVEWKLNWSEPISREDMVKWIVSKEKLDDSWVKFNIFDCIWFDGKDLHNLAWKERQVFLKKALPKDTTHLHRVIPIVTKSKDEFFDAVKKLSKVKGSEGVMLKQINGKYLISNKEENRTLTWAKKKNVVQVSAQITKIIPKISTKTKKPIPGVWVYECAILGKDKKTLIPIGRTYSTSIKAKVGDIIEVNTVRLEVFRDKDGKIKCSWMFPIPSNLRPERDKPDTIDDIIELAKQTGKVELKDSLEICPHWNNEEICPLWPLYEKPTNLKEKLIFPIRCKYAEQFRCPYVKDYYYAQMSDIYTECKPPKNPRFVFQHHRIGKSVHSDLRFECDEHLVGFTLMDPGRVGDPPKITNEPGMKGFKVAAITKAKQPKVWLTVEGDVKPGEIGAGKEAAGNFKIIDSGTYKWGARKPGEFLEVFLYGKKFTGRWIFRFVEVPKIKPETKEIMPGERVQMWEFWKPKNQTPYAVSRRAIKKNWYPPKGEIPVPKEWIKEHPKEFKAWLNWVKRRWEKERTKESLQKGEFVLQHHWWKGAEHWDIRIDLGKDYLEKWTLFQNPLEIEEGITSERTKCLDKKWLHKGKKRIEAIKPGKPENPTRDKIAYIKALDYGPCNVIVNKTNIMTIDFHGKKLKGYWVTELSRGRWIWTKSKKGPAISKPETESLQEGHPEIKPFSPIRIRERGNFIHLDIYDKRYFTKCVGKWYKKLPKGVRYLICSYVKAGTLPRLAIQEVEFDKREGWTKEKALAYFKSRSQKLIKWRGVEKRAGTGGVEILKQLWDCPYVQNLLEFLSNKQTLKKSSYEKLSLNFSKNDLFKIPYFVKGIAIKEGRYNGIFYPGDELKKGFKTLLGKPVGVDHKEKSNSKFKLGNVKKYGKVIDVFWNDEIKGIEFILQIDDEEKAKEIFEDKIKAVSVGVLVDKILTEEHGLTAFNPQFYEISLMEKEDPACKACRIIEKSPDAKDLKR